MKKAQGLSMSTIIIAAIALLVLVILATFLLRQSGEVNAGTSCNGLGGSCVYSEIGCSDNEVPQIGKKGCIEEEVCCLPLST
jgi:hypothetical protein